MSFKICNHCGSRLDANDNYCPKCGTQYQATTNTPQPTEVEYQVEQERLEADHENQSRRHTDRMRI